MAGELLRVLLIQSWVVPGSDVRDALRAAGYDPKIFRVDFESALVAALQRGSYHVVLLDSQSTGVPRLMVEQLMIEHGMHLIPLVVLVPRQDLASDVRIALSALRN